MVIDAKQPWIVNVEPRPGAALRLIACPYAGGGAHAFRNWAHRLPSWIELLAVEPPGRGTRFRDPALVSLASMVESLAVAVDPIADKPYGLFGHSLGALVAFELARHLRAKRRPAPVSLLVSGRGAPHRPRRKKPIHQLRDADFLAAVDEYNGWPSEVRADRELVELLLPILRADFAVCETYQWREQPPLDCPIVAYHGRADTDVVEEDVRAWRELTSTRFDMRPFDGDHFFLRPHEPALLAAIARDLAVACRSPYAMA